MTSKNIYTPIAPTYLYIKQHSVTSLKYFGKTTKDPYKYPGSGKHWSRHIKKHGEEHIVTLWVSELFHDTSIVEYALQLSEEYNIVKSKKWANMEPENGLNGCVPGTIRKPCSDETRAKLSAGNKGKKRSEETKNKLSISNKGKNLGKIPWNKGIKIPFKNRHSYKVKTPKVKIPKVKTPKVKIPKVKTPKVKIPKVKTTSYYIIDLLKFTTFSQSEIALMMNTSRQHISNIKNRYNLRP